MKTSRTTLSIALPLLLLAGCVTMPNGPSIMALPGYGKTFDQFRADDAECRQYASYQIGGRDANQAATDAGVKSAVVGTAVGALAGAAIGGHNGAGAGAGAGLLLGSAAGSGAAQSSAYGTQRSYDHAYIQCMYAKGEQVPMAVAPQQRYSAPPSAPQPGYYPPPPPPGYPGR
ncbi:MAG: hypothetical protein EKK49_07245 [Rhodocyclaceae bacterium]|nr:MAG: hypothetical protein EKK49_07245 [Rhodocyclaceae bacterium]